MRLNLKYPISHQVTEGKPIEENLDASGMKFAVVCARFNSFSHGTRSCTGPSMR